MRAEGTAGSHVDARGRTHEGMVYDPPPPAPRKADLSKPDASDLLGPVLRGSDPVECGCGALPRHEPWGTRRCARGTAT